MGDMADYYLEQVEDMEYSSLEYLVGNMTIEDAIDRGILNEYGGFDIYQTIGKTCRCCGESGLQWKKIGDKFRLFKDDHIHKCKVNPLREI